MAAGINEHPLYAEAANEKGLSIEGLYFSENACYFDEASFRLNLPLIDLHWMISDKTECTVVEQVKDRLKIYQNDAGVLTNNPPFDYHLAI